VLKDIHFLNINKNLEAGSQTTFCYLNKLLGKCSLNQVMPIKCLLKHTKHLYLEKAKNIRPNVIN
jgi:hypothetical protein